MRLALDHDEKDQSWLKGMLVQFNDAGKRMSVPKAVTHLSKYYWDEYIRESDLETKSENDDDSDNPLVRVVTQNLNQFSYMFSPGDTDGDDMFMDRAAFEGAFQRIGVLV